MISEKQLKEILDRAIEKTLEDTRKYIEETVIADFNSADTFSKKITIVANFAESVGYDYAEDIKNIDSL